MPSFSMSPVRPLNGDPPSSALRTVPRSVTTWFFVFSLVTTAVVQKDATGGVVVLANRTDQSIRVRRTQAEPETLIPAGDTICLHWQPGDELEFTSATQSGQASLAENFAYFFASPATSTAESKAGDIALHQIGLLESAASGIDEQVDGLHDSSSPTTPEALLTTPQDPPPTPAELVIPVKILVDEDNPAARAHWEKQLRRRLAIASDIIHRHCGARFEVVAVETWTSDDTVDDFEQTYDEFAAAIGPEPARLAIGFTSQYRDPQGPTHLGGTRGPQGSHILLREWPARHVDPERLEVLVHELGHYLGAVHSPEADSVMRPRLGDRQAVSAEFPIRFDPLNALAMGLMVEGLRTRPGAPWISALAPPARRRLHEIYSTLAAALPQDPAARQYLDLLTVPEAGGVRGRMASDDQGLPSDDRAPAQDVPPSEEDAVAVSTPTTGEVPILVPADAMTIDLAVQYVIQRIVLVADQWKAAAPNEAQPMLTGDQVAERYVREAAHAASELNAEHRKTAFLLGLGLAFDDSGLLRRFVSSSRTKAHDPLLQRLATNQQPTLLKRHDLAQHFAVSAAITALAGGPLAKRIGIAKEVSDARGGSGFSFADLCADMAGIRFAELVLDDADTLEKLEAEFTVGCYLPPLDDLPEGLSQQAFRRRFGSVTDDRFVQMLDEISERIHRLSSQRKD
jgi:hypothetical protein